MGLVREATNVVRGIKGPIGNGLFGVSFEISQAQGKSYPGVLTKMKEQGIIKTMAYSLWLNAQGT